VSLPSEFSVGVNRADAKSAASPWLYSLPVINNAVLVALSLGRAQEMLLVGNAKGAWEWLQTVEPPDRPKVLAGACLDQLSREAAGRCDWAEAQVRTAEAARIDPLPARQERLALLRGRAPFLDDHQWALISATVAPARRLGVTALRPQVEMVAACGAYHSRGSKSSGPWSRYLRMGKAASQNDEERATIFKIAAGYFARFVARETSLLTEAEVVVPVPANPERYVNRMASLPDELARGAQSMLALPVLLFALAWKADMTSVEMKKLGRSERRLAAESAFVAGHQDGKVGGRTVLLVDDIITSGSTLQACAAVLLASGARRVVACGLAHTEG
jgi:hypothetical protein